MQSMFKDDEVLQINIQDKLNHSHYQLLLILSNKCVCSVKCSN